MAFCLAKSFEPVHEETNNLILTVSDTNRAVQSQKMVRGWKFLHSESRGIVLSMWQKKGADQLRSYCEADLRLCFCICRLLRLIV